MEKLFKRNTIHMLDQQTQLPVCWNGQKQADGHVTASNIDSIDCVPCLRMLVKDAVVYGVGRKAKGKW